MPKDFLKPCLLLLLREHPSHGYELLERLALLGFDDSDPGGLYRGLRKLEADGLVLSTWERSHGGPRRRAYKLTGEGAAELDRRAAELADAEKRIDLFLRRFLTASRDAAKARSDEPPVVTRVLGRAAPAASTPATH
jgi:poly-beta-hydroxybutyrate-responsive repressor